MLYNKYIYLYEHNLEYVNVMDQLLQAKTNVYLNFSLTQCRVMCFVTNHVKHWSLNLHNICVTPTRVSNVVKYYNTSFSYCCILFFNFVIYDNNMNGD